jgi:catechol 2,3-dioxygenase-like lactoylglutathione lyase family enzyme
MAVQLNHTIVHSSDAAAGAAFVSEILGVSAPVPFGPFQVVEVSNGVSLDFMDDPEPYTGQHYAFLVSESEFDSIFGRIQSMQLDYWADPHRQEPGEINRHDGGRGVYFQSPDGHWLEAITRPYGSGSA